MEAELIHNVCIIALERLIVSQLQFICRNTRFRLPQLVFTRLLETSTGPCTLLHSQRLAQQSVSQGDAHSSSKVEYITFRTAHRNSLLNRSVVTASWVIINDGVAHRTIRASLQRPHACQANVRYALRSSVEAKRPSRPAPLILDRSAAA